MLGDEPRRGERHATCSPASPPPRPWPSADAPFEGPIGHRPRRSHPHRRRPAVVINPTVSQLEYSDLDLVLSGHRDGVNMIEVGAAEVPEADVLGAIEFGYEHIKQILELIGRAEAEGRQGEGRRAGVDLADRGGLRRGQEALPRTSCSRPARSPARPTASDAVDELRKKLLDEHFPDQARRRRYAEYADSREGQRPGEGSLPHAREEDHPQAHRRERKPRRRTRGPARSARIDMRGRRLRPHPRLGLLPARRDPVARHLHARHRPRTSRSSTAWSPSTPRSSTSTTTSRPSASARPGASWARAGARSVTAPSPNARSWASCPPRRSSPTPSASSATSPSPTARRRWRRSAAAAWR